MRRRELLSLLSGAAAWPVAASAYKLDRATREAILYAEVGPLRNLEKEAPDADPLSRGAGERAARPARLHSLPSR